MKNILIVTGHSYRYLGGIESYHYMLFSNINNMNFIELPITHPYTEAVNNEIKKIKTYDDFTKYKDFILDNISIPKFLLNTKSEFINKLFKYTLNKNKNSHIITKKITQIVKENNIDKILLSTSWYYDKKFLKKNKNKIFFIQHSTPFLYFPDYRFSYDSNKFIKRNWFVIFAYKILNIYHNPLKYINNLIVYDDENSRIIKEKYPNISNIFPINLPVVFNDKKPIQKHEIIYDFISPIRLEKVKNITQLVSFAKLNPRYKFVVCGDGSEKDKLNNILNINCTGILNKNELLKIYKKSRFLLLFSLFEGFSFAITEALSLGIPCIVANTFPSAKYLIGNNNERGFLFDLDGDDYNHKIIDYINHVDYNKTSKECRRFVDKNLKIETFAKKWKEILDN